MYNKIVSVTKEEGRAIKASAIQNGKIYLAEIDGVEIKTEEEYVQAMADAFAFPYELPQMKLGWCNDYLSDLMWLEQEEIVMIIHNYEQLLSKHKKLKKDIIAEFEEIILPWWEGDVIEHMVDGTPKKFVIYLES